MAGEKPTREQAARRIVEIREDPAYWDRCRNPQKHELLRGELVELQAIAMAPPPGPSEEERKAREESAAALKKIAELKADPAYFDGGKDPAKHAELARRVNELAPVAYRGEE